MQNISVKNSYDIQKMREISQITARVLKEVSEYAREGISTSDLDEFAVSCAAKYQAKSSCVNYMGFPKSICTSINHVACHGIPSNHTILSQGDIINIDIALTKDGYHGDTSVMVFIGGEENCSLLARNIVQVSRECLFKGIEAVKPGNSLYDIAAAIESHATKNNVYISDMFCGHGIGKKLHEPPNIVSCVPQDFRSIEKLKKTKLLPGMIFTIEPIVNLGTQDLIILADKWTAVTKDHSLSAQWEHTILVTDISYEILTRIS